MSKIALITDSTSDLDKQTIEKYNIHVLPLRVIYKNEEFIDRVNITPQQVYDRLTIETPTTSMPSIQDMEDLFSKLEASGYTHAIAIPISSGLSGTLNGMKLASNNFPSIITHVFDSKALSMGLGALVIECAELINQGKSFEEIVSLLPSIQKRISVFFVVETLEYLIKGGRIGRVAGALGEFLNLKPIIAIDNDGKYYTYTKVRGRKQSISKLVDIAKDILLTNKCKVFVLHGGALEEGKKIYALFENMPNVTTLQFSDISPVMGVHTGAGLLGLTIVKEP